MNLRVVDDVHNLTKIHIVLGSHPQDPLPSRGENRFKPRREFRPRYKILIQISIAVSSDTQDDGAIITLIERATCLRYINPNSMGMSYLTSSPQKESATAEQ